MGPSEGGEKTGIWVINLLTATPRQIRGDAEGAVPSPDGKLVAFRNSQGVWVVNAGGENARQLLASELEASFGKLQWSPDSQRVAVLVRRIGDRFGTIEAVSSIGGERKELLRKENLRTFVWLADGSFVVATQEPGLGKSAKLHKFLTSGEEVRFDTAADTAIADISGTADGTQLAVVRATEQSDVYVAAMRRNPGLLEPKRLTLDDRDDEPSGWQSNNTILFHSNRNGSLDVFRQPLDSGSAELIAGGPDLQYGAQPSPDGRNILYWSQPLDARQKRLMAIPAEGGSATALFEAPANARFYCTTLVAECLLLTQDGPTLRVQRFSTDKGAPELLHEIQLGSEDEAEVPVAGMAQPLRVAYTLKDKIFLWSPGGTREIGSAPLSGKVTGVAILGSELLVTTTSSRDNFLLAITERSVRRVGALERPAASPIPSPNQQMLAFKVVTSSSNAWLIENH